MIHIADKLRLSIDMIESYNKKKLLNLINYKHLLMSYTQVMELIEKEKIFFYLKCFTIFKGTSKIN